MKSKYLYTITELFYLAILVAKLINPQDNQQFFQVCVGLILPAVLFYSHDFMKNEKKQFPITYWAAQLFIRCAVVSILSFEDEVLRDTDQPALCSFQYLLLGMHVQKYCVSRGTQFNEHKTFMQVALAFQVSVVIVTVQFYHIHSSLSGTIMLIVLSVLLFVLLIVHNFRYRMRYEKYIEAPHKVKSQLPQKAVDDSNLSDHNKYISPPQLDPVQKSAQEIQIQEMLDEQRSFYQVLFDQLPYGMLILNETSQIQYHNVFVTELMQCDNQMQALRKIFGLKNCSHLIKEQERINELSKALNSKSNDKPSSNIQSFMFEIESYQSQQQTVQTEYEHIKESSKSMFNRSRSFSQVKDRDKFQFFCEAKMICSNDCITEDFENLQSSQLFEVILRPYRYENQFFVLFLVRDVTMFNQVSVLQKINENKSFMLAQVAHEFRNPLNIIISFASNLIDILGPANFITLEYLQPIESASSQMLHLMHDLLDLAQMKAGRFQLTNDSFDLLDLLMRILNSMSLQTRIKNLTLQLTVDPANLKTDIVSDPKRIQQIVMNLISNSIKFTSTGGLVVHLQKQTSNEFMITLKDSGVGIEKEEQKKLFKAFGKLQGTSSINRSGVGLGLMISNALAQKLSKDNTGLKVESEGKDKGSSFTFMIYDHKDVNHNNSENFQSDEQIVPRRNQYTCKYVTSEGKGVYLFGQRDQAQVSQLPDSIQMVRGQSHQSQGTQGNGSGEIYFHDCKCIEILIVDDEPFNLYALTQSLEKYVKLDTTTSSLECISRVQTFPRDPKCKYGCNNYKMILMDIEMPKKDGCETTQALRQIESQNGLPPAYIIAYTGYDGEEIKRRIFMSGMNDLMSKPTKPKIFLAKIGEVFQNLIQKVY